LHWNEIAYGLALGKGCSQPVAEEIRYQWFDYCSAVDREEEEEDHP
jgi:hypothetical protein